jgi:hypothetical protein
MRTRPLLSLIGAEVNEAGRLVLSQSVKIALDDGVSFFTGVPCDAL